MLRNKKFAEYKDLCKKEESIGWQEANKIIDLVSKELIEDFAEIPLDKAFKYHQGRAALKPKSIKLVKAKLAELRELVGAEEMTNAYGSSYQFRDEHAYWTLKNALETHYKEPFLKTLEADEGMTVEKILQKASGKEQTPDWYSIKEKGDQLIRKCHNKKPLAYAINIFTQQCFLIIQTDKKLVAYKGEFDHWRNNLHEINLKEAYEEIKRIVEHKFDYEADLEELKGLAVVDGI